MTSDDLCREPTRTAGLIWLRGVSRILLLLRRLLYYFLSASGSLSGGGRRRECDVLGSYMIVSAEGDEKSRNQGRAVVEVVLGTGSRYSCEDVAGAA